MMPFLFLPPASRIPPGSGSDPSGQAGLERSFRLRSFLFFGTILVLTLLGTVLMGDRLARTGWTVAKALQLGTFGILFGYASYGFCHAWFGFWAVRGKGGQGFLPIPDGEGETLGAQARTAVIIPIYHETVSDVIHRVRCNYRSLEETGCLEHFDFFLLSDSQDPAIWSEEEVAWTRLCEELQASGKISYRRRKENLGKKAGNVADFCRRWGRQYAYMIVLDADSLLSGPTAVRMVKMMEAKPRAGLIQSVPRLCRATSLFGRMQQFSMRFYGKIFLAGLSYWQLHNGNYWGHNAIIRMEAFLKHCALPPLPGRKPFGGHILSHDFVEAALLRRAGYEVWLAPGLEDSYEEGPPTLQESAARDRRWCAGNLQHVLVLFAEGFKPASRVHLLGGVMGYLVSPLWLFFLLLSSIIAFQNSRLNLEPGTLPQASSLPFLGGVSCAVQGWWILGLTLAILFVPKCLAWVDLWFDSRRRNEFAGIIPSALSVIAESLFSMLMAPIIMLLHSRFVFENLTGVHVSWNGQVRTRDSMGWGEAVRQHRGHTVVGWLWGWLAWSLTPSFFWWILPVLLGMMFSIPLAYASSSAYVGAWMRRRGLLLTPEETSPPKILRAFGSQETADENSLAVAGWKRNEKPQALSDLVLDPSYGSLHLDLESEPFPREDLVPELQEGEKRVCENLIQHGPARIEHQDMNRILSSRVALGWLHRELWSRPSGQLAPYWQEHLQRYHEKARNAGA